MALSSLRDLLEAHRHKEKELFTYLQSVYTDTSKRQPSYPVLTEDHSLRPATTRPSIRYTRDLGSKELTHGDPTTLIKQERREKGREGDRGRDRGGCSKERGAEERERNKEIEVMDKKEKERSDCRSSIRSSGIIPHHTVGCLEDQSNVNRSSHRISSSPRRREVSIPQPKIPTRRKSFKSRIARKHETVKMIRKILEEHSPDNFKYADRMLRDYLGREEDLLEKLLQDFGLTDERDTAMERERERDLMTSYDKSFRIQSNDSSESDNDTAYIPPHKALNGFGQSAVVSTSGSTQPTTTANRADKKFKRVPSLCHSTGSAPAVKSDKSSGNVRDRDGDRDRQKPRATSLNLPAAKKIFLVPRPLRAKSLTSSNTTSPALDLPARILAPVAHSSSHTLSNQSRIPPAHREPEPEREREGWTHEVPIELPSPLGRYPHNSAPSEVPPHPSPMGPGGAYSFNRTSSTSPSRMPSHPMPLTTEKNKWKDSKCRMSGDAWIADEYMEQDIHIDEHLDQDRDRGRIKESPKWSIGALDSNKSPGVELTLDAVLVPIKVQTSALSRLFQEASPTTSPAESPLLASVRDRSNPFLEAADDMVDRAGRPLGASGESYSVNTITLHLPPRKAALTHTRSAPQMIAPPPLLPTPPTLQRLEHSDHLLPSEASAGQPHPLPVHFSLPPPPPIRSLVLGKSKITSPSSCHDMGCGDRSASQSPPLPVHYSLPPPPPIRYSTLGKSKVTSYSSCYDINRGDRSGGRSEESDGSVRHRCAEEGAGGRSVPATSDCSSISTTTTPLSPCSPTQ